MLVKFQSPFHHGESPKYAAEHQREHLLNELKEGKPEKNMRPLILQCSNADNSQRASISAEDDEDEEEKQTATLAEIELPARA